VCTHHFDELANDPFRFTVRIHIRGVDCVDAFVPCVLEKRIRDVLVYDPFLKEFSVIG
jgi:hypothetical protein